MRTCEGCGGGIAGDRVVCPDCGTECAPVAAAVATTAATVTTAAPAAGPGPGPSGSGAPWERRSPPVGAAPTAAGNPNLGPVGLAAPSSRPPGLPAPTPFGQTPATQPNPAATPSAMSGAGGSNVDAIVAALASLGIMISALLDWTTAATSFRVPLTFLVDTHTTARDPKLGFFVVAIGVAGLAATFLTRRGGVRVFIGALAIAVAGMFCFRISALIADSSAKTSLTEVLGAGPWLCALAGAALAASPLFGRRR